MPETKLNQTEPVQFAVQIHLGLPYIVCDADVGGIGQAGCAGEFLDFDSVFNVSAQVVQAYRHRGRPVALYEGQPRVLHDQEQVAVEVHQAGRLEEVVDSAGITGSESDKGPSKHRKTLQNLT